MQLYLLSRSLSRSRLEPQGPGPPVLAEGQPRQRREHARLPQRHSPPDPRAERGPGDHPPAAGPKPPRPALHPQHEPPELLRHLDFQEHDQLGVHPDQLDVGPPEPQPPPAGAQQTVHLRRAELPEAEQPRPAQVAAVERLPQPADLAAPDQELRAPAELEPDGALDSRRAEGQVSNGDLVQWRRFLLVAPLAIQPVEYYCVFLWIPRGRSFLFNFTLFRRICTGLVVNFILFSIFRGGFARNAALTSVFLL